MRELLHKKVIRPLGVLIFVKKHFLFFIFVIIHSMLFSRFLEGATTANSHQRHRVRKLHFNENAYFRLGAWISSLCVCVCACVSAVRIRADFTARVGINPQESKAAATAHPSVRVLFFVETKLNICVMLLLLMMMIIGWMYNIYGITHLIDPCVKCPICRTVLQRVMVCH